MFPSCICFMKGPTCLNTVLLLLSHFSCVWLCATPKTAARQAPLSLGFSRQGHWSGLPFPSPMHESEKWKWSHSVMSDPQRPHGLQPSRLLRPPKWVSEPLLDISSTSRSFIWLTPRPRHCFQELRTKKWVNHFTHWVIILSGLFKRFIWSFWAFQVPPRVWT